MARTLGRAQKADSRQAPLHPGSPDVRVWLLRALIFRDGMTQRSSTPGPAKEKPGKPALLVACTGVGHKKEKPGKPGFSGL